ncbi:MAG: tape measure protein [Aliishimia sp.]
MTTERLHTEYTADTRNFRRGARVYDQSLARQERLTNTRLSRIDQRWDRSTRSILATRTALSGLSVIIGGSALVQLRNYGEGWRDVERRLDSIGEASVGAQRNLVALALRTRGAIGGTVAAVQRLAKSTGDGIEITSRRVETLQKLLASAGASGSERASVSLQLGQALQSGVLSGDEFRSIRENSPVEFLDTLAKAAGTTRAELKDFAEDQLLTTDIVLKALDGLSSTADQKFGALAISGEEAFNVLTTGLTAYVGNVDKTLGATETINTSLVKVGEYLSEASVETDTFVKSIKIVGTVALAIAGSRGLGALNSAYQRSAQVAGFAAQEAQKEVAVSGKKVVAARQELAAQKALLASRQTDLILRQTAGRKTVRLERQIAISRTKVTQATTALAGAEVRAVTATDRFTAAQLRLSFAARATASALRTASSVLAFFGGPLGLAITALATLPLLVQDVEDRLENFRGAADKAQQAMDRYADASKRAGQEQDSLGGKISDATSEMLRQSRVSLQDALGDLQAQQAEILDDLRGVGLFNTSDITAPLGTLELELQRLYTQYGGENQFLSGAVQGLKDLKAGTADLQVLSAALNDVRSVGDEAFQKYDAYMQALQDNSGIEAARQSLLDYAQATGVFATEIETISNAQGPENLRLGFENLAIAVFDAATASRLLGDDGVAAIGAAAQQLAQGELRANLMRAELEGNTGEADRLRAALLEATGQAEALANTDLASPITTAANEASRLAKNLAAARSLRLEKLTGGNPDFFDPRNESGNAGTLPRKRAAPANNDFNVKPKKAKSGSGGSSAAGQNAASAERDLAAARGLLVENGQKALFIETELASERERLRNLLPSLTKLGLSRADAEAVLNSELERTEERLKRVQTASEQSAETFAQGILSEIRNADDLGDAISRIGDRLLDLALDPVFDQLAKQFGSLFSGGGSGQGFSFGNLFSGLFGGFRENGGSVSAGRAYVVGEKRPELFVPGRSGTIVPSVPTMPSAPVSAAASSTQTLQLELVGGPLIIGDSGAVMAEVDLRVATGVGAGLSQNNSMILQKQRRK